LFDGDNRPGRTAEWERSLLSGNQQEAVRDAIVPNREGLHARPVMRFVDLAARFSSAVKVANISKNSDVADGKSAMQMMLLEATQGSVLRISARGADAEAAAEALARLVLRGFQSTDDV